MARYVDAEQLLDDDSNAFMAAQLKVNDEATRLVNEVVHKKVQMLIADAPTIDAAVVVWHKITTRPLNDDEKEWYAEQGYEPYEMPEFIYDCEMPEDGQEILIATPWGTDKDTCSNDAEYGIGLECHDDFDNVYAWAELPKYEEEEDVEE